MRLSRFEIQNFRTIHQLQHEVVEVQGKGWGQNYVTPFRIDPRPGLNLLVGPNGVGKSNVLAAIKFALSPQDWVKGGDNRNHGTKKRSIDISTTWRASSELLNHLSLQTRAHNFMRDGDQVAISRTFHQIFVKGGSKVETSYAFSNHEKGDVDPVSGELLDLESLCLEAHHLLSIETMPTWNIDGLRILEETERKGIAPRQLFEQFSAVVNDELLLRIDFDRESPDSYEEMIQLFSDTSDRFGENPLASQGKGVQAVLVYALAIAMVQTLGSAGNPFGFTLLLDEPENGLHIDLQRRLSSALSRCITFESNFTAIITTNSPFLIPQNSDGRVFEIEEFDGATIRKNFKVDSQIARHWLESDQSVTSAMVSLLGSKSIARVVELFRKSEFEGASEILIVEGYLDRHYIEVASRHAGRPAGEFRIVVAGESLEIRDEQNREVAGVFLLALQVLLAYGWAGPETTIWAIADADAAGLQTLKALSYLIDHVEYAAKNSTTPSEDVVNIHLSNTNRAVEAWGMNYSRKARNLIADAVWIETEFEDLFPKEYLDRYFQQADPKFFQPRSMKIYAQAKDGKLEWVPMTKEQREKSLPRTLHDSTLNQEGKSTSPDIQGTFPRFLNDSPPTAEESEVFLSRLKNLLTARH